MIRPQRKAFNAGGGTMVEKVAMHNDAWFFESPTE